LLIANFEFGKFSFLIIIVETWDVTAAELRLPVGANGGICRVSSLVYSSAKAYVLMGGHGGGR
jgi:hypothetical protein